MASYIDQSLVKNEVVLHRFKHHWSAWIGVWVCLVLGFLLILPWIYSIAKTLELKGMERAVTNRRIVQKRGVISRRTDEMKLTSIETVEIQQGVFERIFGAGTVKVTGRGISDVILKNIDDPMTVKKQLEEAEDYRPEESGSGVVEPA